VRLLLRALLLLMLLLIKGCMAAATLLLRLLLLLIKGCGYTAAAANRRPPRAAARYYIDGEETASIDYALYMGVGLGGNQGSELEGSGGSQRTPCHPVEDPLDLLQIGKAL
jgi:hypothetical protein